MIVESVRQDSAMCHLHTLTPPSPSGEEKRVRYQKADFNYVDIVHSSIKRQYNELILVEDS